MQELTRNFDLVIITASPLLHEMDSIVISQVSDLMVMVYDWKRAGIGRLVDAAKRQCMFGGKIDLLILNRFPQRWKSRCPRHYTSPQRAPSRAPMENGA